MREISRSCVCSFTRLFAPGNRSDIVIVCGLWFVVLESIAPSSIVGQFTPSVLPFFCIKTMAALVVRVLGGEASSSGRAHVPCSRNRFRRLIAREVLCIGKAGYKYIE